MISAGKHSMNRLILLVMAFQSSLAGRKKNLSGIEPVALMEVVAQVQRIRRMGFCPPDVKLQPSLD